MVALAEQPGLAARTVGGVKMAQSLPRCAVGEVRAGRKNGDSHLVGVILQIISLNSLDGAVHQNEWPALAAEIAAAFSTERGGRND